MVEATVRPYEPSWRDRLAMMMMGDSRVSPERRRVVEGLLGSSGLGNTGMNVADFTPAGLLFAGNEYARAREEGDNLGAALAMASMVPGAGPVAREVVEGGAKATAKGIRAYHGSPYDFDKFSIKKVGTGSGGQSQGSGLYVSESENYAMNFRDMEPRLISEKPMSERLWYFLDEFVSPSSSPSEWLKNAKRHAEKNDSALFAELSSISPSDLSHTGKGRMYEVNINADPENFIELERPLSEQSKRVQEIFDAQKNIKETDIYDIDNPETVSRLRQAGIPGAKYADDGTRNYVVFDDSLIEILRKYGIVPGILGGGAAAGGVLGDPQANGGVY